MRQPGLGDDEVSKSPIQRFKINFASGNSLRPVADIM